MYNSYMFLELFSPYYSKKFNTIIFFSGVAWGEGSIFIFSLLLKIRPSNININIFIFIKDNFFLNLYIFENIHRNKQLFKLVKVLVNNRLNIINCILIHVISNKYYLTHNVKFIEYLTFL